MRKLRVGIAGYGVVGKRRRACIDQNSNTVLVAVCDINFEGEGTFDDGVRFYSNYQSLLKQDIDVLFVCLTNDLAPEVTIAGLEHGLHIFCEKPPGRNVHDIINVVNIHQKYLTSKLMFGFNHRYHESVKEAYKIIKSGRFGKIINMRGIYGKSKLVSFDQDDWRTKRNIAGGGILLDQGIHMVDLMRYFSGEFLSVQSHLSNRYWGYDVEDNAYALMVGEDGVVAMLNSSATQWRHRFNLDINLEGGSLILGGILSGTKSYGAETLTVASVDHENDTGDPKEQRTLYNNDRSWEEEIEYFVNCILEDHPVIAGSPIEALNTMKLVNKIYYSDPIWRKKYGIVDLN